jgi:hypothetical protein
VSAALWDAELSDAVLSDAVLPDAVLSDAGTSSGWPSVIVPPCVLGLAHGAGHWSRPGSGELDISRHLLVIGWLHWTACPLRFPRVFLDVA